MKSICANMKILVLLNLKNKWYFHLCQLKITSKQQGLFFAWILCTISRVCMQSYLCITCIFNWMSRCSFGWKSFVCSTYCVCINQKKNNHIIRHIRYTLPWAFFMSWIDSSHFTSFATNKPELPLSMLQRKLESCANDLWYIKIVTDNIHLVHPSCPPFTLKTWQFKPNIFGIPLYTCVCIKSYFLFAWIHLKR